MKFMSLTNRNFKEVLRDPVTTLLGVFLPLLFLILFSLIQAQLPLELFIPRNLTPGIIIFSFSFLIMFSATLLTKDRHTAFLVRLYTTPLKASDYIISYIIPFLVVAILQIVVCFAAGLAFGGSFQNMLVTSFLFMLIALMCICLGIIFGTLFTVSQVSGIGSVFVTFIGLLSGIWIDLSMIGGTFEQIGYVLPFAHAVDASRSLLSGKGFSDISQNLSVVAVYTVVMFVLAVFAFKRNMRRG